MHIINPDFVKKLSTIAINPENI